MDIEATLRVDDFDPINMIDLYVPVEDFKRLCKLYGTNRITVVLRIKGVG